MASHRTLDVRIAARSGVHLGTESAVGNFGETLDFIPGAVLRGAVAARCLMDCTQPDHLKDHSRCPDRVVCPYWQLFETEPVLFGSAYPGQQGPVWPFPLTARTCKYHPGMKDGTGDIQSQEYHGVHDVLIKRFAYELLTDPAFPARSELAPDLGAQPTSLSQARHEACPQPGCGAPMEQAVGYYTPGAPPVRGGEPFIRRMVHVGINRARFVAEDRLLFTQEELDAAGTDLLFFGQVIAPQDKVELLGRYLDGEQFIGRGRSRGSGLVSIAAAQSTKPSDLDERLKEFNAEVAAELSRYRKKGLRNPIKPDGLLFSLTLHSPAILESFGRPYLVPSATDLGIPEAQLLRAWTAPQSVVGWDAASGMPRRTRLAAVPGSVYLFHLPSAPASLDVLETLERDGLGVERERGYGRVEICSAFHMYRQI